MVSGCSSARLYQRRFGNSLLVQCESVVVYGLSLVSYGSVVACGLKDHQRLTSEWSGVVLVGAVEGWISLQADRQGKVA